MVEVFIELTQRTSFHLEGDTWRQLREKYDSYPYVTNHSCPLFEELYVIYEPPRNRGYHLESAKKLEQEHLDPGKYKTVAQYIADTILYPE